jgi:alpha-L-fucosidase 2
MMKRAIATGLILRGIASVLGIVGIFSGPAVAPLAKAEQNQNSQAGHKALGTLEPASVVGRSDILLERPNLLAREAMPLGNGRLGVAVWGEEGFTAQLNRADTLPNRLSPGQVVIPGLKKLVGAPDYAGRVDLYDGEFAERGGGMTATVFVQPDTDVLVVEVKGADPSTVQQRRSICGLRELQKSTTTTERELFRKRGKTRRRPGLPGRRLGLWLRLRFRGGMWKPKLRAL